MNKVQINNIVRALAYIHNTMQGSSLTVKEIQEIALPWKRTVALVNKQLSKPGKKPDEEEKWKSNVNGAENPSKNQNPTSSE